VSEPIVHLDVYSDTAHACGIAKGPGVHSCANRAWVTCPDCRAMSTPISPDDIGAVIGANIRAERARCGMAQDTLSGCMRALGYGAWFRQTVGEVEHARRRVTAVEIVGLASVLNVPVSTLLDVSRITA
jgi:hypothetical protein